MSTKNVKTDTKPTVVYVPKPRVNHGYLKQFMNKEVTIPGVVGEIQNNFFIMKSSDNVDTKVFYKNMENLAVGGSVEAIGKVNSDLSVTASLVVVLPELNDHLIDFDNYNKLVNFIHNQCRAPFQAV
jgi:hypothetical protein